MSKLGWEPMVDFDEGMQETVTWYVKNIGLVEERKQILVYGSKGWIGEQFVSLLKSKSIEYITAGKW